jgi:hypothetical protein
MDEHPRPTCRFLPIAECAENVDGNDLAFLHQRAIRTCGVHAIEQRLRRAGISSLETSACLNEEPTF